MGRDLYVLKAGEIWLKGGNKPFFEQLLRRHIKKLLSEYNPKVLMQKGRFFLWVDSHDPKAVHAQLSKTFGLVGFSKAYSSAKDMQAIRQATLLLCNDACSSRTVNTFKIDSRRIDKSFSMDSYQISCNLGSLITQEFPQLQVNLSNPDLTIFVEIRDNAYVYADAQKSPGGLPPGSAGKGLLMLSGGIDSPISGYLMAKRGLILESIYFHAYPFTSDEALEKVRSLTRVLSQYTGGMRLWVVPFTELQLHIKNHAPEEERTLHLRSAMIELSNRIGKSVRAQCLITGEALSQVASQTVESLAFTNSVSSLPVFRPLIGMDKEDIIAHARHIGTYETSILPYDDCCTLFTPSHPLIKPDLASITSSYESLGLDSLIKETADRAVREQW